MRHESLICLMWLVHYVFRFFDWDQWWNKQLSIIASIFTGYHGRTIALTALLSKDTVVGGKAVVKYDRILTNVGGAYSPITGIFTVPYTGIYSISCSLTSHPDNRVHLQITKNGNKLSILYAAETTYPLSGQTLELLLRRGDKIWIQNRNEGAAKLHDHGSYNLFSGALIKRVRVRHVHIYRWNIAGTT